MVWFYSFLRNISEPEMTVNDLEPTWPKLVHFNVMSAPSSVQGGERSHGTSSDNDIFLLRSHLCVGFPGGGGFGMREDGEEKRRREGIAK